MNQFLKVLKTFIKFTTTSVHKTTSKIKHLDITDYIIVKKLNLVI